MIIKYRRLRKDDIDQLIAFFRDLNHEGAEVSFSEVEKKEEIESWLNDERMHVFVADYDGEVLGVLRGKQGKVGRDHSCFLTAATNKKYRGHKIAQNLTKYSLSELKEIGVKIARAYIYSNNAASVSTILKCGFTSSGCVHMHHYEEDVERYVDDLIFHKIL
ncbi:GNAT family N-acetyltransferase [Sporosalibacterium faouarense]|uniref:GNAT family N-acetyltransferase n=1 Tax=Sporosalibacterium faouarense TaxID=516123 RepID=UPI00141C02F0|nr:GNAT family N-acetyltransferase [Sporosalibacterium faouarense]MTI49487.1 GNAT family N-acetyltransferase [Bacillota bacterium]